jgi:hypothetical protein
MREAPNSFRKYSLPLHTEESQQKSIALRLSKAERKSAPLASRQGSGVVDDVKKIDGSHVGEPWNTTSRWRESLTVEATVLRQVSSVNERYHTRPEQIRSGSAITAAKKIY